MTRTFLQQFWLTIHRLNLRSLRDTPIIFFTATYLWSNLEFLLSRQRTWFDVCSTEWHHGKGMGSVLVSANVGNHHLQGQLLLALQTVGKERSQSNQGTVDPQKEKDYNGTNYLKTKRIFILLIWMHVWWAPQCNKLTSVFHASVLLLTWISS